MNGHTHTWLVSLAIAWLTWAQSQTTLWAQTVGTVTTEEAFLRWVLQQGGLAAYLKAQIEKQESQ